MSRNVTEMGGLGQETYTCKRCELVGLGESFKIAINGAFYASPTKLFSGKMTAVIAKWPGVSLAKWRFLRFYLRV